ncbi:MAG: hypothetical protein ABIN20_03850 [candidate division WOR-3 bacterium]
MQIILLIFSFQVITYGNERWNFARNARISSLGEASSALKDPASFFFNPATPLLLKEKVIQGTFSNYFSDIFKFGAFNLLTGDSINKFFLSLNYIFSDKILYTIYKDTTPAEDPLNIENKGFISINSIQILSGFSKKIKNIYTGISLKLMRENLYVGKGYGMGIDIGFLFKRDFNFSFTLRNAFGNINIWDSGRKEFIPPSIRIGISKEFLKKILFTFDFETLLEEKFKFKTCAGIEFMGTENFFLRAGWRENIPTFGTGLRIKKINIDYALGGNFELSLFHIISASIEF